MDGVDLAGGQLDTLATLQPVDFGRRSYPPIHSVQRALHILSALNRRAISSIDQLHGQTGLPKSTVVRMLETLMAEGYVTRDQRQGGYAVTSMVDSLSCGFHGDPLVVQASRPWALALTRKLLWPVSVAVLDGTHVVVRFSTVQDSPISPQFATINMRLNLIDRAMGLAYLAFCPTEEREFLLDMIARACPDDLAKGGGIERLDDRLQAIRADGFVLRSARAAPLKAGTVAVPLMKGGLVLGTLGMGYFRSAVTTKRVIEDYVPALREAAGNIEAQAQALSDSLDAHCPTATVADSGVKAGRSTSAR